MNQPTQPTLLSMKDFLQLGTSAHMEANYNQPTKFGLKGPFGVNGIQFSIENLLNYDRTDSVCTRYSGSSSDSPSSIGSLFESSKISSPKAPRMKFSRRFNPNNALGPTPDFQTMKELMDFRAMRTAYHQTMRIAEPLEIGSSGYEQRWAEALRRFESAPVYQEVKIVCRSCLFNPANGPIPQKVKNPLGAAHCYIQWRMWDNAVTNRIALLEWKVVSKDFNVYKTWATLASDLYTEHLYQKEKGYVYVLNKKNSRRIRNVEMELVQ